MVNNRVSRDTSDGSRATCDGYDLYICRGLSTNRSYFMQNKANFIKEKINATFFATKDYENEPHLQTLGKQSQSFDLAQDRSNPISKAKKRCCVSRLTDGVRQDNSGLDISMLTKLEEFRFSLKRKRVNKEVVQEPLRNYDLICLAKLTNLERLGVGGEKVTDNGLIQLSRMNKLKQAVFLERLLQDFFLAVFQRSHRKT